MFIVLLHYIQPLASVEMHLEEHRRFLDRHYAAGHFLASGPQVPRTGGVILVKDISRDDLDDVLAEDPFHREQIASYQVIEFNPTRFGTGAETILTSR
ncbi:YciI family protein [Laribacter hongkongensis]|uniref:YciI family protein n=1 Tax=Laribacter hongkongensis TaxID=168471 RepID=UPI001EFC9C21|nr:YciI family protein [Laribacter hongkongensis]MCG9078601.1 YciI family protein [Laribacter hongkongensis]